jgi:hypothetical protein
MIKSVLAAWAGLAAYGFALGLAHSPLYATRNLAKLPILATVIALVCGLSWWIIARTAGARLSFLEVQRVAWLLFHDLGILLASLAPIVVFLAIVLRTTDDGHLGEYDTFLGLNVGAIALCGAIALAKQARHLFMQHALERARAIGLVGAWLVMTAAVGGQAAFYMRPFFGFPATRGAHPPFFLGAEADLRGATNFFEAVAQTLQRPPLELPWQRDPDGR